MYDHCYQLIIAKLTYLSIGKKKRYCLKYRSGRVLWPAEKYAADDVSRENLSDLPFADFSLPCPRNHEGYLDATYGADWRNTGRSQSYNHIDREWEVSEDSPKPHSEQSGGQPDRREMQGWVNEY